MLKVETTNFAYRFINDATARADYQQRTAALVAQVRRQVSAGELTPLQAAREVNRVRNSIMEGVRQITSDQGRAFAEAKKATGKTLPELQERYAQELFQQSFETLAPNQRNQVWLRIVQAGGQPNAKITRTADTLNRIGRGLVLLSVALAFYNIATAQDKTRQTAKEAGTFGAGVLGGALGGGAMGLACGPGAPVCVTVGIFVGGVLAAAGFDLAFDAMW